MSTLLHRLFDCLWAIATRICHYYHATNDSNILLPTSSPVCPQGITIRIYSPPEDLFPADDLDDNLSTWLRDKEKFLQNPSLSHVRVSHGEKSNEEYQWYWMPPTPSQYRRQDRAASGFLLSPGVQATCANLQTRELGTSFPKRSQGASPTLSASPIVVPSTPVPRLPQPTHPPSFDSPCVEKNTAESIYTQSPGRFIDTSVDLSKATPRPTRRVPSGHTEPFWDPPSLFTNAAARMVPIPSYTGPTIPRPTNPTTYSRKPRFSLLPYPELFDFGMYDSSASQASVIDFFRRDLPPDVTTVFDTSLHLSTPTTAYPAHRRPVASATHRAYFANKTGLQDRNVPSKPQPSKELNLLAPQLLLRLKSLDGIWFH